MFGTMAIGPDGSYAFEFVAGRVCLDFANTVGGMRPTAPREHLLAYEDLVRWSREAGIVSDAQARRLRAAAARDPEAADRALRRARDLREAIYRAFEAASRGRPASDDDVAVLNRELCRAASCRRLVRQGKGFAIAWPDDDALDGVLRPVATSAAELLASPDDLARVHLCGASEFDDCSWLFVDETRAGTRRWCSMKDCGNRAKQRRHYHRTRAERDGA
jgi:predicted RNA-binding Zn ribbon-like protein